MVLDDDFFKGFLEFKAVKMIRLDFLDEIFRWI